MRLQVVNYTITMTPQIKCPHCSSIAKSEWVIKTWKYASTIVSRYKCKCDMNFNYYKSAKSSWTIPKSKPSST